MIYRLRMDGGSRSPDELEREFFIAVAQFGQVGLLEGIMGSQSLTPEIVAESKYGEDEIVRLGNSRFGFPWQGRCVVEFRPPEGSFEALRPRDQAHYATFYLPDMDEIPGNERWDFSKNTLPPNAVEQRGAIVLQRRGGPPPERVEVPILADNIGDFTIAVLGWDNGDPVLPGWTRLLATVSEMQEHRPGEAVAIGERYRQESVVRIGEADDESKRMLATAQEYVRGLLAKREPGVEFFTAKLDTVDDENAVLDEIRSLHGVIGVHVSNHWQRSGVGRDLPWSVHVEFNARPDLTGLGVSARAAALAARDLVEAALVGEDAAR